MNPRPYILAETNWKSVKETDFNVAVLPWGATEAHNYHLPYGTDNYQSQYIAEKSAKSAWEKGGKVILLPTVPFGVNTGQLDIKLCLNINPSTQLSILKDLVKVLANHNIEKLVILNGHGGNDFKPLIRELYDIYPEIFICCVNWYQATKLKDYFVEPGDHAGEMETSNMMHISPELVLPLAEASSGKAKNFKFAAFKEGWAYSQRLWTKITEDTGVGNPKEASAEKGERHLEDCIEKIGNFLLELSETELDDLYE